MKRGSFDQVLADAPEVPPEVQVAANGEESPELSPTTEFPPEVLPETEGEECSREISFETVGEEFPPVVLSDVQFNTDVIDHSSSDCENQSEYNFSEISSDNCDVSCDVASESDDETQGDELQVVHKEIFNGSVISSHEYSIALLSIMNKHTLMIFSNYSQTPCLLPI